MSRRREGGAGRGANGRRVGNVLSPGGGGGALARMAVLASGFPTTTSVAGAALFSVCEEGADEMDSDEQAVLFGVNHGSCYCCCDPEWDDRRRDWQVRSVGSPSSFTLTDGRAAESSP